MAPGAFNSTSPAAVSALGMPVAGFGVTSGFGPRRRPKAGASTNHKGIDWGTPVGTPVVASADGILSRLSDPDGFGNYASIKHPDGSRSIYAHLDGFDLPDGAQVKAGQRIGRSGRSGNVTGPHLHHGYYLPDGTPVDPRRYYRKGR